MQPKENKEFFSDGRNVTVTFSHLLLLLPSRVSLSCPGNPLDRNTLQAALQHMCPQTLVSNPTLWPPLQALGKQGWFWGDPVSLTLCLGWLKQMYVSVWEKGKPAILAQGLTPAENSTAPLSPGHVSQGRMAALPCTGT